jgi:hypothetical protein
VNVLHASTGGIIILALVFSLSCSKSNEQTPPNNVTPAVQQSSKQASASDSDSASRSGTGADSDGDGVADVKDAFPSDPMRAASLPLEFDAGVIYSREIFVSPSGDDSKGHGSASSPYRTVARAAQNATPGTRIKLQAGIYPADGSIKNLHGTLKEPIAIVANGDVVFDAAGAISVMHFSDPRYVVLQGFTVKNTKVHGVNIDDGGSYDTPAEHIIIRNLKFHNIGTGGNHDCLKMSGVDRFMVLNSEFDDCDHGEAIDMVGCHEGVIKGNVFKNIPINAINTKGGSADILIQGNRFTDIASRAINAGGHTGFDYYRPIYAPYEGARIHMLANIFERVGTKSGAAVSFTGCDHCVFANNTIIEPRSYIVRILQERQGERFVPSRYGYFINNIIVFNTSDIDDYVNIGEGTSPETFTFGNNLWYALNDPEFSGPDIPSVIPSETGSIIQQNPQLDIASENYTIPKTSPAAGGGRDVPSAIATDYSGAPYNSPIDIGAFSAQ